ncbi:MAG TPA: RNA polymerase sigma factor, partial [Woeseiaceae bacterium]
SKVDARLIRHAAAGDEQAFTELLGQVRGQIFRWALIITADSDDAEDIAQQVSLTLHRRLHTFRMESGFETWLYRVVRNTAFESRRRVRFKREVALDMDAVESSLTRATEDKLVAIDDARSASLIRAMFTELPPRQRELIELVDTQGYKAVEAAEIMEIEPETARVHLLRARRTLRSKMLAQYPERFE